MRLMFIGVAVVMKKTLIKNRLGNSQFVFQ